MNPESRTILPVDSGALSLTQNGAVYPVKLKTASAGFLLVAKSTSLKTLLESHTTFSQKSAIVSLKEIRTTEQALYGAL